MLLKAISRVSLSRPSLRLKLPEGSSDGWCDARLELNAHLEERITDFLCEELRGLVVREGLCALLEPEGEPLGMRGAEVAHGALDAVSGAGQLDDILVLPRLAQPLHRAWVVPAKCHAHKVEVATKDFNHLLELEARCADGAGGGGWATGGCHGRHG